MNIFKLLEVVNRSVSGCQWGQNLVKSSKVEASNPLDGLRYVRNQTVTNSEFDDAAPIFVLSTGWRAGSTFVQRILATNKELMMWGEPYHRSNLIEGLMGQLAPLSNTWPLKEYYADSFEGDLSEQFSANCWPNLDNLRVAHQQYWLSLFSKPAIDNNYKNWGIKEVRWGEEHIEYLRWLFPKAKFLLLCRNPIDSYESFYSYPRAGFLQWPIQPILTARDYGKMWVKRICEFEKQSKKENTLFLRYEDLKTDETYNKLTDFFKFTIAHPANLTKISLKNGANGSKNRYLPKIERWLLNREIKVVASKYGY